MNHNDMRQQVNICLQEVQEIRQRLSELNKRSEFPGSSFFNEWLLEKVRVQTDLAEAMSRYWNACKRLHDLD
jgi:hypothetical protein